MTIKPPKLNVGDTIGLVASSTPVMSLYQDNFMRGKQALLDLGFKIKEGKTMQTKHWWMAGTPKEVAEDINQMFADKEIKAIFAQNGGYSAISVLEYLDYELITNNPKPFMGLSDMTVYLLAIFAKTGQVGFHMDYLSYFTGEYFLQFLASTKAPGIIAPKSEWEAWKSGKAEGYLIGGLLERMSILAGSEYFPKLEEFDGAILSRSDKLVLFWEEIGRDLTEIYQYLYQLKNMGILGKISGMLIGKVKYLKPVRDEAKFDIPTLQEMVLDICKDFDFPIMANLDFGHIPGNIPMPIGVKVSFDTSKKELNFLESAVKDL